MVILSGNYRLSLKYKTLVGKRDWIRRRKRRRRRGDYVIEKGLKYVGCERVDGIPLSHGRAQCRTVL